MKLWKVQLVMLLALLSWATAVQAEPKSADLKFVLYYPQVPPYMYQDEETQKIVGLVPEVLQDFFQQQNIRVQYVADNRTRAEHRLYQGEVDAILLAKEWTQHPDQLLFSEPLLEHQDYLFARQPMAAQGQLAEWVKGKAICTRQYYVYEALTPFFQTNETARVDSSSEMTQLKMLLNGRCDFAFMNEHVANWLLHHHFPDQQLYRSAKGFSPVGLTVAFHPRWKPKLVAFNQYLAEQRQQGIIAQWLKFYVTKS
ncbi:MULTISPECIES: substrate-binding periplasmic protein [Rheinheimera]|uniref:substrate-binding periplasmic protein n=1 Tax=Rheinheimera TaxID=67575 RepID=UPI001E3280C1|nr:MULTISPECIES: transporter substrate-binding domain-containing protein [Rheinheimera]HJS13498.1 transporter substrate-binding domain-containing protein [Rheinheimera sp.]